MPQYISDSEEFSLGFKLNMRILADVLERRWRIAFYSSGDRCSLIGARFFQKGTEPDRQHVYFLKNSCFPEDAQRYEGTAFIVTGEVGPSQIPQGCPVIVVLEDLDILEIYAAVQDSFDRFREWDWRLQHSLDHSNPLDEILLASMELFRNPMFIHDNNFLILSDPKHVPAMSVWEKDPRTGYQIVSMELINDFRTDVEYIEGLKARHCMMFSSNQTGYQILYRNLWVNNHYIGRILVDEVQTALQPGSFYVLDYLGNVVEYFIQKRHLVWMNSGSEVERFFTTFIREESVDTQQLHSYLSQLHWNPDDRYICLRIVSDQKDFNLLSAAALLGQIENQVTAGRAFYYERSITVVVNLSYLDEEAADVVSRLAILMRDSLLKTGISAEFQDIMMLPKAYIQARIALEYGMAGNSMLWYYYFEDYTLDYILHCAEGKLPLDMLCTSAVHKLRKYDMDNHTELNHTLKVYLLNEKNVLQTSRSLYIHRSTLFYRLQKIQKIIGVDLEDPKERLKLLLSYYMQKQYSNETGGNDDK